MINESKISEFTLLDNDRNEAAVNVSCDRNVLTVTPKGTLKNSTKYTLTVPKEEVSDLVLNRLKAAYKLSFTTIK